MLLATLLIFVFRFLFFSQNCIWILRFTYYCMFPKRVARLRWFASSVNGLLWAFSFQSTSLSWFCLERSFHCITLFTVACIKYSAFQKKKKKASFHELSQHNKIDIIKIQIKKYWFEKFAVGIAPVIKRLDQFDQFTPQIRE